MNNTAYTVVSISVIVKQTGKVFLPNTVFVRSIACCILIDVENACFYITIRSITEVIFISVKFKPSVAQPFTGPPIMCPACVLDEITANELACVVKYILVSIDRLFSCSSLESFRHEIIVTILAVFIRQIPPSRL